MSASNMNEQVDVNKRTEQTFICTREEALKLVRKSRREGASWAVSIRLDARIVDKPDSYFLDACSGWINVTRKQAAELIKSLLSDLMEQQRGARIHIWRTQTQGYKATYWITQ